jgi:alpha-tubulin suppressor-like RCC1 family protein
MAKIALSRDSPLHSLVVARNNTVFGWGVDGSVKPVGPPTAPGVTNVKQVAAGSGFSALLTFDGRLFTLGNNAHFQPGLSHHRFAAPTQVNLTALHLAGDDSRIKMVACGNLHVAALTRSGRVCTFGENQDGELGLGAASEQHYADPQCIPPQHFNDEPIAFVVAGRAKTMAVSARGNVYAWGRDGEGTLGVDDAFTGRPQQIDRQHFDDENVSFVALGENHSVALTTTGSVFTWGCYAHFGRLHFQLGRGELDMHGRNRPRKVHAPWLMGAAFAACGDDHTLVVTADGELWACGLGQHGELGLGDMQECATFRRVGRAQFGDTPVAAVAAGSGQSAVVLADRSLWIFGTFAEQTYYSPVRKLRAGAVASVSAEQEYMRQVLAWHPRSRVLALAMGLHRRLGRDAGVFALNDISLRMIATLLSPDDFAHAL